MNPKQRLHELVERLPVAAIERAVELLQALVKAPVDPEMLARINAARRRARLRTAIDEGDASGIAGGDVFARVWSMVDVRGKLRR